MFLLYKQTKYKYWQVYLKNRSTFFLMHITAGHTKNIIPYAPFVHLVFHIWLIFTIIRFMTYYKSYLIYHIPSCIWKSQHRLTFELCINWQTTCYTSKEQMPFSFISFFICLELIWKENVWPHLLSYSMYDILFNYLEMNMCHMLYQCNEYNIMAPYWISSTCSSVLKLLFSKANG
jgi:hypothetical protein